MQLPYHVIIYLLGTIYNLQYWYSKLYFKILHYLFTIYNILRLFPTGDRQLWHLGQLWQLEICPVNVVVENVVLNNHLLLPLVDLLTIYVLVAISELAVWLVSPCWMLNNCWLTNDCWMLDCWMLNDWVDNNSVLYLWLVTVSHLDVSHIDVDRVIVSHLNNHQMSPLPHPPHAIPYFHD